MELLNTVLYLLQSIPVLKLVISVFFFIIRKLELPPKNSQGALGLFVVAIILNNQVTAEQ